MGIPAAGRFSSGHASHQSGLDADIWLQMPRQRWTAQQLLKPQPIDLVAVNGRQVNPRLWQPQVTALIKLAAQDQEVTRIFVNPAIKKQLCQEAGQDRDWLRKSASLVCAQGAYARAVTLPGRQPGSQDQDAPPAGDGCGAELSSWFTPHHPTPKAPVKTSPPLPGSCQVLLDKHL